MNPANPMNPNCYTCNNLGWRIEHHQGDPVTDHPGVFHLETLWVQCGCRMFVIPTILTTTTLEQEPPCPSS